MSGDEANFGLVLAFDSDDSEFCRGVEAGRLWEQLKSGEPVEQMIHATNAEMAIRMCEELGLEFNAEQIDDRWIDFSSPPRPMAARDGEK